MQIRNAMEDFHVEHLSDAQMKELNPIIRQAVFDTLNFMKNDNKGELGFLVMSIPEYWELPKES
jgi:hypothetical protein